MFAAFHASLLLAAVSAEARVDACAADTAEPATPTARTAERRADAAASTKTKGAGDGPGAGGKCVDTVAAETLLAKRKMRLTTDRLFVKNLRHELAVFGGYYVADLFDGTFSLGGSYTFFMSENFGTELSVSWSRLRTSTADVIEKANNFDLDLEGRRDIVRVFGTLVYSPLYGKVRLFAKPIVRYDFYLAAGPGVVVDPVSFGAAGNFGVGVRIFLHQAVTLRFDLRDYLFRQEILSESYLVNDLAFTAGIGVLLPLHN
ncbi:MAG: outer membrane beta-barrel domain-containing protein [Deltaproteobacteria bacterium]|nr:MAG: outer membrane beta-barrel domain-containing protein [Deltaproteobacteria bacterium]